MIHRLVLGAIGSATLASTASANDPVWATPAALRGHWVTAPNACNVPNDARHLRITPAAFEYGKTSSRIFGIHSADANGAVVDLVGSGDGRQWTKTTAFRLLEGGKRMTARIMRNNGQKVAAPQAILYRRCK